MTMVFRSLRTAVMSAALLAPVAIAQSGRGDPGIMSGVFTTEQVARGRVGHRTNCGSCHGSEKYTGEAFASAWKGRTLFELIDLIKTTMPEDNPGALPEQEYVDIVAYVLSINGYPPGAAELKWDDAALKAIKIDTIPGKP